MPVVWALNNHSFIRQYPYQFYNSNLKGACMRKDTITLTATSGDFRSWTLTNDTNGKCCSVFGPEAKNLDLTQKLNSSAGDTIRIAPNADRGGSYEVTYSFKLDDDSPVSTEKYTGDSRKQISFKVKVK